MKKVITYGTYDFLHYGHIRLLERAKALGDYLIVGITADDFDKNRGKINVQQSLMERIEAVRSTGIADEIIIEEYEGQKIDDIQRYGIDIFTVGSDWKGKFDYLNDYCRVIYLDRTEGVSSTGLRSEQGKIKLGLVGGTIAEKFYKESGFVNGLEISGLCMSDPADSNFPCSQKYENLMSISDAVYIEAEPYEHYNLVKMALMNGKHVLCEAPLALSSDERKELRELAGANECVLMDAIKTAYSTAYHRLILLLKSGKIGDIVSVDATATSLRKNGNRSYFGWNSINAWGPTALLPIFHILGNQFKSKTIISKMEDASAMYDSFTKIDFVFEKAVASIKVGKGIKSEGELIVSGTNGYVYVPAPWWKTDYFEIRYENPAYNKRYFYQLDGEGIRYELIAFLNAINTKRDPGFIGAEVSETICSVIEDFHNKIDMIEIS